MTQAEYLDWAKRHGAMFGFGFAEDWKMLLSWFAVLGRYDGGLLGRATDEMARATEAAPLRSHLHLLQQHIRGYIAVDLGREKELARDTWGTCTLCGNSGYVSVPWLRVEPTGEVLGVAGDEWLPVRSGASAGYHTMAVTCSCRLGHNTGERHTDPDKKPMGLETYQKLNRHWQSQLIQRKAEERKSRHLAMGVAAADQLEAWKADMRKRWGIREPGEE